jgi:hypothetical protein
VNARTRRLPSLKPGWEKELLVASFGDTPPPSLRDVRQCVILCRGDDVPAAFLTSLVQHGIEPIVIGHPLLAFAELLQRERQHHPGRGWGLPTVARTALVVANRDQWDRLDPLLEAVRSQLPHIAVWVTTANLFLDVREIPEADDLPAFPEGPQLRLAGTELPKPTGDDPATSPSTLGSPTETSSARSTSPPEPNTAQKPAPDTAPPPAAPEPERPVGRSREGTVHAAVTPEEIEMLLRLFPTPPREPNPPTAGGGI